MDIERIRQDFPALKDWTYLDTAFVGLFPVQVRRGYDEFLDKWMNFELSSGKSILGEWLDKAEEVRGMVASLLGASSDEIAFTTSTGSGLNVVVNGLEWGKGDNVVFPEWEHNALDTNRLREKSVEIRPVKVREGRIQLEDLDRAIDDRTKLVQTSHVGYVNGHRADLHRISEIAHERGAKTLVDATQAVGGLEIDVRKEDIDYLSAAPYKYLMGPAGLAFLYLRREHIERMNPDRVGWKNQIWEGAHPEEKKETWDRAEKFEYGTIHFQGIYGLEKSLEYLQGIGIEKVERRNLDMSEYLWRRLSENGARMYTPRGTKSPIVSFYEKDAVRIASRLREEKIKVTGREAHGGHIRASCHFYNTEEDVDRFVDRLMNIKKE